jgi:hypothetical protein
MDRKKELSYSYFELNKEKYYKLINNQLKLKLFGENENKRIIFKERFISDFRFLFGITDTLKYLVEWIINEKNINIPENTIFVYVGFIQMREQGLTWTQGIKGKIKWKYTDGKLVETDVLINNQHKMTPEMAQQVKMRNI